jgi:hypothetical protein
MTINIILFAWLSWAFAFTLLKIVLAMQVLSEIAEIEGWSWWI